MKWVVFYFIALTIFGGLFVKSFNVTAERDDTVKISPTISKTVTPQLPATSFSPRASDADITAVTISPYFDDYGNDANADTAIPSNINKLPPLPSILYRRRRDYNAYHIVYHVFEEEPWITYTNAYHPGRIGYGYHPRHTVWDLS